MHAGFSESATLACAALIITARGFENASDSETGNYSFSGFAEYLLHRCVGWKKTPLFEPQVVHLMCGAVLLFRASTSHLGLTKFRTLIESPATTTVVVFHIWSLPCTCPLALFHFLRLIDEERLEWPALSRVVVRISKIMRRATS
eukprot:Polyplicarium_translucidae@DN1543_c0_g1_i2.p1